MKVRRVPLALVAVLAFQLGIAGTALAGAPTDQLRAYTDRVFQVLRSPESKTMGGPDHRAAIRRILDEMFDWSEMARQALGRHWEQRTPEERAEFTRLFSDLFEESYVSTVKLSEALTFTYLGDSIAGERAVVRTTVTTRHGNEIAVAYRTRLRGGAQWKVYDLDVESVSLVGNYRFQINKILLRSSYRELLEKLKQKSKRDGAGRSGTALPSWEISTPAGYDGGGTLLLRIAGESARARFPPASSRSVVRPG